MKAKKQFGQNFLHNRHTLEFIVASLALKSGDTVVEIGGGTGNLTKFLVVIPEIKLFVIELDNDCIPILQSIHTDIVHDNILNVPLAFAERQKVVGNIPYYITKPIISHLYTYRHSVETAILMVQYEVARLLCAHPGESEYAGFSAYVQSFADVQLIKKVSKGEFSPAPTVDSALVQLTMLPDDMRISDRDALNDFVFMCFKQRRKTLLNNLKAKYALPILKDVMQKIGFRPDIRAEALSIKEITDLYLLLNSPD